MYIAAFIFEPGTYDNRFHALDANITPNTRTNPSKEKHP